jgi:hypothetical protein
VEIIAKFSMTKFFNKEPWLLCYEQRFISGEISHQTKRGPATSTKGFLWGKKSPNLPYFEEKKEKSPYLDYRSFSTHEHIAPKWVSKQN